jgi:hypothetical protein
MITQADIIRRRLYNQRLSHSTFTQPAEVVGWLGAVQSQDYAGAKWALGLRLLGFTDAMVDHAFQGGTILRTHLLRPTWHFVAPADLRWMLALTAPRVHALNGTYYRRIGLDAALAGRIDGILVKALQGGEQLTRDELRVVLEGAGIHAEDTLGMAYFLMRAELEAVICSGPGRGKQFTYMLMDERVPPGKTLSREAALAELVRRYFLSHGPATVQDFVWWSGLTTADARLGLESIQPLLVNEVIGGQTYWFSPDQPPEDASSVGAYLLPNYDELGSHKDRSAMFDPVHLDQLDFFNMILLDGRIIGTWRRTFQKKAVEVEMSLFEPVGEAGKQAINEAAQRLAAFLEVPVTITAERNPR